ncbi:hypothetical protein GALMADRAFT_1121273 [Galerina marginata CBS 339.88]|uniref:Uncharacterized protein n=1 Tax=Galerina marginata (strain CBS 339.88) TaxID=685588 RepID=A0A067TQ19_GALM3|nr:hypothetical protein GALMADRAFT_1121273 [Galerina marginata CBS 339.88]
MPSSSATTNTSATGSTSSSTPRGPTTSPTPDEAGTLRTRLRHTTCSADSLAPSTRRWATSSHLIWVGNKGWSWMLGTQARLYSKATGVCIPNKHSLREVSRRRGETALLVFEGDEPGRSGGSKKPFDRAVELAGGQSFWSLSICFLRRTYSWMSLKKHLTSHFWEVPPSIVPKIHHIILEFTAKPGSLQMTIYAFSARANLKTNELERIHPGSSSDVSAETGGYVDLEKLVGMDGRDGISLIVAASCRAMMRRSPYTECAAELDDGECWYGSEILNVLSTT